MGEWIQKSEIRTPFDALRLYPKQETEPTGKRVKKRLVYVHDVWYNEWGSIDLYSVMCGNEGFFCFCAIL